MTKTQMIQDALNLIPDDIWGPKTDAAVAQERAAARERQTAGHARPPAMAVAWPEYGG